VAKPILCLDFDGVIHSYASGWKGADIIPDPPVAGAADFIVAAQKHFTIAVYSSRSGQAGGIDAMKRYVHKLIIDADHDGSAFDAVTWPTEKPPAQITIDDRALTFMGVWPRMSELLVFQPWNKRLTGATGDHPQGKLNREDEGGLRMGVAADIRNGVVRVDFGKPVAWLGLDKATALALSDNIRKHANSLKQH
jgi:hypothetical protein